MIRGVRMNYQVVIPVLISFAISVILGPIIIPFLRKLKMGQTERVEGVQSHLKKAGTPTMGGVIFLIATVTTICRENFCHGRRPSERLRTTLR